MEPTETETGGPAEAPASSSPSPPPPISPSPSASRRQTQIPQALLWIAAAAVVLRIVTAVADRPKPEGAGLVGWKPFADATALSQQAGKPVLYDFTAAWCVPCHHLDAEAWGDAAIAKGVTDRFVPARIVDRQREDGHNPSAIEELERRFHVEAFPTLIVADATGKELARMEGYGGRERLESFLSEAVKKFAPIR